MNVSTSSPRPVKIAIVGAGFSGIAMALALQKAGMGNDMLIIDKDSDFGGTWRVNTYPGCECDVPSPVYSLRGEHHDWSHFYGSQPEILDYIMKVVGKHGLHEHARFNTTITRQEWDAEKAHWTLHTADGDLIVADVVINGVGPLTEAVVPDIPGRDDFAGPAFHSAWWRHDVDLTGVRVGVIGTGASTIQIVPSIVDQVRELTVFQRTPSWVLPKLERTFTGPERWVLRNVPGAYELLRGGTNLLIEHGVYRMILKDERTLGLMRRLGQLNIRRGIADGDKRRKVTPELTPGCKRMMFSNRYYGALGRDHVDIETTGIDSITSTGVTLVDGREVDLDVIVWGTGFNAHQFWMPMEIVGVDGATIEDTWGTAPAALNCVATPGFPNNFFLLGPNSGTGHNSVIMMAEAQVDYIMQALAYLRTGAADWLEPTVEATAEFAADLQAKHQDLVWATGCDSWYVNEKGVNDTMYPGNVTDYQRRIARFDIDRYHVGRHAPAPAPAQATAQD